MTSDQPNARSPILEWRDDLPVAVQFDDTYFSSDDGLAETKHVFLAGNELPARFCDGFHVAELGFGTGLNFLATWAAWRASGISGQLLFTSFEAFPMKAADARRALSAFPQLSGIVEEFFALGWSDFTSAEISLRIIQGNAEHILPQWQGVADAWFLDGFSPAKNPELWGEKILRAVTEHTTAHGTFATYTAAGHVRRALTEAGFDVERVAGHGRKRHMSRGRKR